MNREIKEESFNILALRNYTDEQLIEELETRCILRELENLKE